MSGLIIVKYGEIALKGANRPAFEAALQRNLRWALRDTPGVQVRREQGRFTIEAPEPERLLPKVVRVFGVVGASVAVPVPLTLEAMQKAAAQLLAATLQTGKHTFKVHTRRANKKFPLTTPELNSAIGAYLLQACPGATVDVHEPEIIVNIEVRTKSAYIYSATLQGSGGLPVGVSSKGLLLISGGIDSPVAGWMAMRRGIALEAIHFHSHPYTSDRARQKVLELAEILAAYAGDIIVHMVHFTDTQLTLRDHAPAPLQITLMRRIMLRVAQHIAQSRGIPALITGENVGQVASQTLESMAAINAVTNMPILRPLIAADKREITWLARQIGTYETSVLPYEDCCTLFLPPHPETKPKLHMVEAAEAGLDIDSMVTDCLAKTEMVTAAPHTAAALYSGGPVMYG